MEKRKIDCEMYLISESNINGFKVWLYEIESQIGSIYIVDHEQNDKTIITEFKTDKGQAEKLYKKHIKKMIAENMV